MEPYRVGEPGEPGSGNNSSQGHEGLPGRSPQRNNFPIFRLGTKSNLYLKDMKQPHSERLPAIHPSPHDSRGQRMVGNLMGNDDSKGDSGSGYRQGRHSGSSTEQTRLLSSSNNSTFENEGQQYREGLPTHNRSSQGTEMTQFPGSSSKTNGVLGQSSFAHLSESSPFAQPDSEAQQLTKKKSSKRPPYPGLHNMPILNRQASQTNSNKNGNNHNTSKTPRNGESVANGMRRYPTLHIKRLDTEDTSKWLPEYNSDGPETVSEQTIVRRAYFADVVPRLIMREKVMLFMDGMFFTLLITTVVLGAIGITIAGWFGVDQDTDVMQNLELVFSVFFLGEVCIRWWAMGFYCYLQNSLCRLDLLVTVLDWTAYFLSQGNLGDLVVIRVLRAIRLTKISKISRLSEHSKIENDEGPPLEYDEMDRIVKYDPDRLFSLGYAMNIAGTVLTMPEIWIQFIFLMIITTLWAVNICPKECDPNNGSYAGPFADDDQTCDGCVVGFDSSTGLMFAGLVAFMLGLFDSMTFDRWWATRILLADLFEQCNNSGMFLATFINKTDPLSTSVRYTIMRYLNLALALGFKQIEEEEDFTDLVPKYLTEGEWDRLQKYDHKYAICYMWACTLLRRLVSYQVQVNREIVMYPIRTIPMLVENFARQRTNIASILVYLESQIPYTYTHLMTLIVKTHLIFVTAVAGTFVGRGFIDVQLIDIVWGYLIILLSNITLEGLLRIHVVLFDPFGDDACDFPVAKFLDYVWESSHSFNELITKTPPLPLGHEYDLLPCEPIRTKDDDVDADGD